MLKKILIKLGLKKRSPLDNINYELARTHPTHTSPPGHRSIAGMNPPKRPGDEKIIRARAPAVGSCTNCFANSCEPCGVGLGSNNKIDDKLKAKKTGMKKLL